MAKSTSRLPEGVTASWRADGILVYHFHDFSPATLAACELLIAANDARAVAAGQHLRSLYYVEQLVVTVPVILTALRIARNTPPELRESLAVIVQPGLGWTLVANLIRRLPQPQQQAMHLFTEEATALAWLEERQRLLG